MRGILLEGPGVMSAMALAEIGVTVDAGRLPNNKTTAVILTNHKTRTQTDEAILTVIFSTTGYSLP